MRIPSLLLLILALGLAGAATADPTSSALAQTPPGQCRAAWIQADTQIRQCSVTPVSTRQSMEPFDQPAHHVMTKDEIRAELDAIKLDRIQPRPPTQPAPTQLSERN